MGRGEFLMSRDGSLMGSWWVLDGFLMDPWWVSGGFLLGCVPGGSMFFQEFLFLFAETFLRTSGGRPAVARPSPGPSLDGSTVDSIKRQERKEETLR